MFLSVSHILQPLQREPRKLDIVEPYCLGLEGVEPYCLVLKGVEPHCLGLEGGNYCIRDKDYNEWTNILFRLFRI